MKDRETESKLVGTTPVRELSREELSEEFRDYLAAGIQNIRLVELECEIDRRWAQSRIRLVLRELRRQLLVSFGILALLFLIVGMPFIEGLMSAK
ncbi:hypothetical protein [Lysinibacter cavernae]|uniref:hypothetical protein n=1 Tax=Lysinibacter cavernae TaxID=1640652 RepID=UPI00360AA6B5